MLKPKNMKKLLVTLVVLFNLLFTTKGQSTAFRSGSLLTQGNSLNKKITYLNDFNTKAVRDFSRTYPDAANVRWYSVKDGFLVYYIDNDINAKSAYDLKGDWTYTIRWLDEFKLPNSVRHLVKSTYYDYAIRLVAEISNKKQTYYRVQMEDNASFLTVIVADDVMETKEELRKSE
jgi:hypothetical protein